MATLLLLFTKIGIVCTACHGEYGTPNATGIVSRMLLYSQSFSSVLVMPPPWTPCHREYMGNRMNVAGIVSRMLLYSQSLSSALVMPPIWMPCHGEYGKPNVAGIVSRMLLYSESFSSVLMPLRGVSGCVVSCVSWHDMFQVLLHV